MARMYATRRAPVALAPERFDAWRKPCSRGVGAFASRAAGVAPSRASTARGLAESDSPVNGWL